MIYFREEIRKKYGLLFPSKIFHMVRASRRKTVAIGFCLTKLMDLTEKTLAQEEQLSSDLAQPLRSFLMLTARTFV
ncbi:hypothetical protein A8B83_17510 [Rhodobacteraceae bacterium EhC02]|nr:hypothetical protein A8B83_17510 [Rhodobacteraceae bacterium EhC02]